MADNADSVEFCRPEYRANLEMWRLVSDACAGQHAVKIRGEVYLPRPNPSDNSAEAKKRYEHYLLRAVFYNATGRTLSGLVGTAFGKWPEIKLPATMKYLEDDADGGNVPLVGQAMSVMGQVLKTSRAGLLVDFPPTPTESSLADVEHGNKRATINYYPAHSIVNWRTERRAGTKTLTLVVLRETEEQTGDFNCINKVQYRVLRLTGSTYSVEVWKRDDTDGKGAFKLAPEDSYTPLTGAGKPWDCIPFVFIGAVQNTPDLEAYGDGFRDCLPDRIGSPLYDIAVVNLAHYRNSADHEDSTFLVGQPQPWMAGLDVEWRDALIKQGMYIGSRTVIPLPVGGEFGMAQAQENTLVAGAMKDKEALMMALGAKLIEKSNSTKTATQASHDESKDNSVLSLVCDNVSQAYAKALNWACVFMAAPETAEFSIDTEFSINSLDGPSITATVGAWQAGLLPDTDAWASMRKFGLIDAEKTDDEIKAELDAQKPKTGLAAGLNGLLPPGAPDPTKPPVPPVKPDPAA